MASDSIYLEDLINQENSKIKKCIPSDLRSQKIILHAVCRAMDVFYNFLYKRDEEENSIFYDLGYSKALQFLMSDMEEAPGWVLNPVDNSLLNWINSLISHCGRIALAERFLIYEKAGIANVIYNRSENTFYISYISANLDIERFDRQATRWYVDILSDYYSKPELEKLSKEFPTIQSKLSDIVDVWKEYFIQYQYDDTSIDHHYEKIAHYLSKYNTHQDAFPLDFKFSGINYDTFLNFVELEIAVSLKHKDFCSALIKKNREIKIQNILGIVCGEQDSINDTSRYMKLSKDEVKVMLSCVTLNKDNYNYHTIEPGGAPPPFIKLGTDSLIRSSLGCEMNPFEFLNKELKRRFPSDYFKAVNQREELFRNQLYLLLGDEYYLRNSKNIVIKSGNIHTDIDAVVYNKFTNNLYLFQLKWQDSFGKSLKERYSRISNFYPKAKEWVGKIQEWIENHSKETIMTSLGFDSTQKLSRIKLFVINRNAAHFTGETPDNRVSWCTWHQFVKVYSETPKNIFDPLENIHEKIRENSPVHQEQEERQQFHFKLGENTLIIRGDRYGKIIPDLSLLK